MTEDSRNPITEVVDDEIEAVESPPPDSESESDAEEDMPLPHDPRTFFLGGLFVLAVLAALYAAAAIVLPVVLAIVLKLLLQPFVRVLDRCGVPRGIGALIAVALLVAGLAGLVSALTGPAADWAGKLPSALPQVEKKLAFLHRPFAAVQGLVGEMESVTNGGTEPFPRAEPAKAPNIVGALLTGTATTVAGLLTTLVVLFYLLVAGEIFLRRLVEILPRFRNKRQAVELSLHIERNISVYLLTITVINLCVGVVTSLVMWGCGLANPLLWGTIAFVLNYVPILGPMVGIVVFLMASVLSLGVTWWALLPPALYFCIHVAEGELFTPMLLARRFTINPVAVMLALVFWFWMWGVPGAVLAVPMLAIIKIVCDDLRPLRAVGHFLEG